MRKLLITAAAAAVTLSLVWLAGPAGAEPAHLVRPLDEPFRVEAIRALGVKTGRRVMYNDMLVVEATGTVSLSPTVTNVGPAGLGAECGPSCINPEGHRGALTAVVMEVSGEGLACVFEVGASFSSALQCQGKLLLVVNDDSYADNSGAFAAVVSSRRRPPVTCINDCATGPTETMQPCLEGSVGSDCTAYYERYNCLDVFFGAMQVCDASCQADPQFHACAQGCAQSAITCVELWMQTMDCESGVDECRTSADTCFAGCAPEP